MSGVFWVGWWGFLFVFYFIFFLIKQGRKQVQSRSKVNEDGNGRVWSRIFPSVKESLVTCILVVSSYFKLCATAKVANGLKSSASCWKVMTLPFMSGSSHSPLCFV